MLKNIRLLQGLRVLPKLLKFGNNDKQNLSSLLFNERLHRLFQYLDFGEKSYLRDVERQYFFMSLKLVFPAERRRGPEESRRWKHRCRLFFRDVARSVKNFWVWIYVVLHVNRKQGGTRFSLSGIPVHHSSFSAIVKEFMAKPEAKLALKACEEDLERVEHAAELFNETTSKVMIKVSCIVLVVLCLMPFLEVPADDLGDWQSMMQLDALSMTNKTQQVCRIVQQYCQDSTNDLLFLALNFSDSWQLNCFASACGHIMPWRFSSKSTLLDLAEEAMKRRGLQPHEYILYCLPDTTCESAASVRTLALFDMHSRVREDGYYSMAYTALAISMMLGFVYVFGSDLRTLKKGVLLPMWELLDEMAAMKVLEFARVPDLKTFQGDDPVRIGSMSESGRFQSITTCIERCLLCYKSCQGDGTREPEEIKMLKSAFGSMRQAMHSWAKYVPAGLVKRLVCADAEAQLGVSKHDVTVMFIDILEFDQVCKGKSPTAVLEILCRVQQAIADVLEMSKGTLLEMIGDEMLAIYNAPFPVRNHAEMAVLASISIMEAAEEVAPNLRLRCGIHRAEVLTGNIGSQKRMKYGILGDGVNAAARLKSLNSHLGTSILVSEETLNIEENPCVLGGEVLCRPAGHFILKGRLTATKIWEVVGLRPNETAEVGTAIDLHRKGFTLYLNREFPEARRDLIEANMSLSAAKDMEEDYLSRRLIDSCDALIESPPGEGWNGAEALKSK